MSEISRPTDGGRYHGSESGSGGSRQGTYKSL